MNEFYTELQKAVGQGQVLQEEAMAKHTTFRVGGPAQYFVSVRSVEQLKAGLACCKAYGEKAYVIGNGSNILVSDQGIRGVVFQIGQRFCAYEITDTTVTVQAGMLLGQLGQILLQQELTGFEFAAGIPGSIGGAVYMNAGAYGGEMNDVIQKVSVLNSDLEVVVLSKQELKLGYRSSIFMKEPGIILEVVMQFTKGNRETIKARMDELAQQRRSKQPLSYPSAGSTFKRPEGYFAGKLIQDCGLRGYQVGGAQVSEKHCGFVINKDHATAQDIYQLTEDVSRIVAEHYQVKLEREVRLLGTFPC